MKFKKIITLTILFANWILSFGQVEVWNPKFNFDCLQDGIYQLKGIDKKYTNLDLPIISPDIKKLDSKKYTDFLNPQKREIVLFANHDIKLLKPIAKLNDLTQVRVDTTFYKYKHKKDNIYTNCVWNRIVINDKAYYTDVDIHDFQIDKKLKKINQNLSVIGQYDGYDGAYHLGYPEYLFLIFTNDDREVIHKTNILNFYLNDEFAMEEDILKIDWIEPTKTYSIKLIGADEKLQVNWDGKNVEIKKL